MREQKFGTEQEPLSKFFLITGLYLEEKKYFNNINIIR